MPESAAYGFRERAGRLVWPLLALALLLGLNAASAEVSFFRLTVRDGCLYGPAIDVLNRGAPLLLAALGMTLVIATGGVDLSVGAVLSIGGAAAAVLLAQHDAAAWVAALAALAVCLVAGLWNGAIIAFFGVQPIVATLVLMVAGRGIAQLMTAGQIVTFENPAFAALGTGYALGLPLPVWIALCAYLLTGLLVRRTALGLFVEAVGSNETASRYAGVNVRGVKLFVYALSGVCAGLAGLIAAADIKAADANNAGLYLELDAILAAVLGGAALTGGRFSLLGTLIGALFIQTMTTMILLRGVPVEPTLALKALIVLGVCLLQSEPLRRRLMFWRAAP